MTPDLGGAGAVGRVALQLDPAYYDAVVNLARLLNQMRQWRAAFELVSESLPRVPREVDLLMQGALAAEAVGRMREAAEWLGEIVGNP